MGVSLVPTLKLLRPTAMIVGVAFVGLLFGYWLNRTFVPGTEPAQPIAFSHRIHAGDFQIDCLYCHSKRADVRLGGRSQRRQVRRLPPACGAGPAAGQAGAGVLGEPGADSLGEGP